MRIGWCGAAVLASGLISATVAAQPENTYNDALMKMTPRERATHLAQVVGYWCVGTNTFFMGIAREGPEVGYAYWSLSCLESGSYAIQIDPSGGWVAISCEELATRGQGRECFKKF
jgi:hypothetical protein